MDPKDLKDALESYYAGAVVTKLYGDGMVGFLVFTYTMPGRAPQLRFPGGGNRPGEKVKDTLRREFQTEVSEPGSRFILPLPESFPEIHRITVPGQTGGEHQKIFFLIPDGEFVYTLRRGPRTEEDGVVLGIPVYMEAEVSVLRMFADHTPKHHSLAALKALKFCAELSQPVAMRYGTFIDGNSGFMERNS